MSDLLARLSESVSGAQSLEALTRPLLSLLEEVTALESTYLTTIDLDAGTQHIVYARNSRTLQIPEGLTVPWEDTLCKRALDEGRMYTDNVGECWGDSQAAAALGIETYLSMPVYAGQGALYGTLCAASSERRHVDDQSRRVLALFASLIGAQIERERLLKQLLDANAQLSNLATTDPLTGLFNRRALLEGLPRCCAANLIYPAARAPRLSLLLWISTASKRSTIALGMTWAISFSRSWLNACAERCAAKTW